MDRHDLMNGIDTQSASETLRESQGRYRTLFDLAPIAVYSCDASGVVREYNNRAAELWGREAEEQRERQRLAMELHEDLAQLLALTRMKLNLAKRQSMQPPLAKIIDDAEEVTSKAITCARALISQLSPLSDRPANSPAMGDGNYVKGISL